MRLKQLVVLGLFLTALGIVFVLDFTRPLTSSTKPQAVKDDGTLKATITNVERRDFHVTLSVRVQERDGNVFGGLTQKGFSVSEDGQDVPLKKFLSAGQQPLRAFLLIDQSGSMDGDKLKGARDASLAYVNLLRDGIDEMGLIFFETTVHQLVPIGVLDPTKRKKATTEIGNLTATGSTQMYKAMEQALEAMKNVTGRRLLLVLTDGMDDESKPSHRRIIIARAKELKIPLYMVGLGEGKEIDEPSMKEFAAGTGGQYLRTPRADELKKIYLDIGKSLQNEYVVEYDSPYPVENGMTRRVTVALRHGDRGTSARGEYKVPGVLGVGARKGPSADGTEAVQEAPFLGVFVPLLLGLGLLFAVPYVLGRRIGQVAPPTPAVAQQAPHPPAPVPVPPAVRSPAAIPAAEVCPYCKQYRAPGPPGQRFCMVCERNY
jgi:VWFA-related protein